MENVYKCPHCQATLNPGRDIVLRAEHAKHAALVLLSPKLGDYAVVVPSDFKLESKQIVDFSCPVCAKALTSRRDKKLAEIVCQGVDGSEAMVAFSRTYGHHATYYVEHDSVQTFGEHAVALDLNFWGEGPA